MIKQTLIQPQTDSHRNRLHLFPIFNLGLSTKVACGFYNINNEGIWQLFNIFSDKNDDIIAAQLREYKGCRCASAFISLHGPNIALSSIK